MRWGIAALLLSLFSSSPLAEDDNSSHAAHEWLARMNQAVASMDYEGHFVYQHGQSLEAMLIRHQIVEGEPRESLLSLTGVPREVIRDTQTITIITSREGKLVSTRQPAAGKLSPLKPLQADLLQQYYRIMIGSPARIAGRQGVVVALVPRDDLRYGYRLTLDQLSALPLDLTVLDDHGTLISRIMFTDLRVTDITPVHGDGEAQPIQPQSVSMESGSIDSDSSTESRAQETSREEVNLWSLTSWRFNGLPDGFELTSYQKTGDTGLEHFVFSDGLATISAYLEPLNDDQPFEGQTSLGSVNALGRRLGVYQLTVVGEVPLKALQVLASAVHQEQ